MNPDRYNRDVDVAVSQLLDALNQIEEGAIKAGLVVQASQAGAARVMALAWPAGVSWQAQREARFLSGVSSAFGDPEHRVSRLWHEIADHARDIADTCATAHRMRQPEGAA